MIPTFYCQIEPYRPNMTKRVPEEKIILYTNRGTWAVRVHIVLRELNLEYEEVLINLDEPRPDWYLKLNPLGKVPTLKYGDEVLRESSTIVQFLTDLYPSQLSPASTDKGAPLWVGALPIGLASARSSH